MRFTKRLLGREPEKSVRLSIIFNIVIDNNIMLWFSLSKEKIQVFFSKPEIMIAFMARRKNVKYKDL